jgi:hypothetical protein
MQKNILKKYINIIHLITILAIVLAITKQKLKKDNDAKNLYMKALLFYPGDQTALEGFKVFRIKMHA